MKSDTGETEPQKKTRDNADVVKHIDATGMQCPGPILRLKEEVESLSEGQKLTISASDPGFPGDVEGWCHSTGHRLIVAEARNGAYHATVEKRAVTAAMAPVQAMGKRKTIVVFSGDFDKAMAAFIIANGAAAMGSDVTLFFTFWG